ncbi:hypothetical protein [Acetobacter pasteurianus]|nr:hypothetical protein [Acetobacter pasteurianus]
MGEKPTLERMKKHGKVLWAVAAASAGEGGDGYTGADPETVRDLLMQKYQVSDVFARAMIEEAERDGIITPGDPQP